MMEMSAAYVVLKTSLPSCKAQKVSLYVDATLSETTRSFNAFTSWIFGVTVFLFTPYSVISLIFILVFLSKAWISFQFSDQFRFGHHQLFTFTVQYICLEYQYYK